MSRRKAPAERSRVKSHVDNEQEEAREKKGSTREKGDAGRETPSKAGGRLSRSGRPRGVQLPTQSAPTPKSEREEEEPCSNKKTPKRLSKSKSWMSTINSPSNDTEQQHEIFWDPHSPTPFKLENGKRKQAASKCAVDISDIVKRIAPKTEKPTNPDAAYIGMWIGDDAIPCTPVVTRDRTKMTRFKILHTEEELMKLAKQFDRNLVETVHHDKNGSMDQINDTEPALDANPEEDVALDLKSVSQHSDVDLRYERSSQKSVDLRAEADFNALFDSSTQKYSGQLSQSSSAVSSSTNSRHPVGIDASGTGNLPAGKQDQLCEKPTCSKQTVLNKLNSDGFHTPAKNNTHAQKDSSTLKEPTLLSSVPLSQDDFEDEWGTDILEDDSFVMQITQNPSLIATPKQDSPASLPFPADHGFQDAKTSKNVTTSVNCEDASAESNKPSHFKFVLKNRNECGKDAKPSSTGKSKNATMMSKAAYHSNVRCTATTKMNLDLPVAKPNNNDPATGASFVGGHLKNSPNTSIFAVQSFTSRQGNNLSVKICPQTVAPKCASTSKGSDDWEWEDPKLSDELLDMCCESDRLWETKEEDDDDDLLYQVCDDVERLTQAQMEEEHNKIKHVPSSNLKIGSDPRESMTDKERLNQSKLGTQTVISNATNSVSNRCNAIIENSNRSTNSLLNTATQVALSSTYGTPENDCSRTGQVPSVVRRSTSVPLGGQCDYKKATPKDTHPQSQVPNSATASKYNFTRIKPSQVSLSSTSANTDKRSSAKDAAFCGTAGNKTQPSGGLQGSVHSHHQPSLKRQLSESILKSTKVFVAEGGNKKCSLDEIERKKQEALARRQKKGHGFDASRT